MGAAPIRDPEIDSLRQELAGLHREIADAKIERSTKHLELMRNWLSVYARIQIP